MTTPIADTVQQMSDQFHAMSNQTDLLLADLSAQLQAAIKVRAETGMSGIETQRTIKHLTASILNLTEARGSLALAHSAAEQEAEKADLPWSCPDKVSAEAAPQLHLVEG